MNSKLKGVLGGQCLQQYSSLSCNKNRLSQQLFLNVNDTFGVLIMQFFSVKIATTEGKKNITNFVRRDKGHTAGGTGVFVWAGQNRFLFLFYP